MVNSISAFIIQKAQAAHPLTTVILMPFQVKRMTYMKVLWTAITAFICGVSLMGASSLKAYGQSSSAVSVLELFTSEGCSSCPPADKALSAFDQDNRIIALSCHVTYWDYLSPDQLSRQFCTDRQLHYSVKGGRKRRVFTPQLIVNGQQSFVGSNTRDIQAALKNPTVKTEGVDLIKQGDQLNIKLPVMANLPGDNVVTLITYGQDLENKVLRGENRGRIVRYTNPILSVEYLSDSWRGDAQSLAVRLSDKSYVHPVKGYVVLVHKGTSHVGAIFAAGRLEL
jgi:hypothetical protein